MSGVPKYKIGDQVCLKSGGAFMTVSSYSGNMGKPELDSQNFKGVYRCQWFAGRKLDDGGFPEDSLVLVTESDETITKK